jgi:hypothetical protein
MSFLKNLEKYTISGETVRNNPAIIVCFLSRYPSLYIGYTKSTARVPRSDGTILATRSPGPKSANTPAVT